MFSLCSKFCEPAYSLSQGIIVLGETESHDLLIRYLFIKH